MPTSNGQTVWQHPALHRTDSSRILHHGGDDTSRSANHTAFMPEASTDAEDDGRRALFADLFHKTEDKIALLFRDDGSYNVDAIRTLRLRPTYPNPNAALPPTTDHEPIQEPPRKKAKRVIDEDDYGDDDEDEDSQIDAPTSAPNKGQNVAPNGTLISPSKTGSSPGHSQGSPSRLGERSKMQEDLKATKGGVENGVKALNEARLAVEETARRNFHTIIHTLENDRAAMAEQQQLEESEQQLQDEMETNGTTNGQQPSNVGSLSNANLGASSLTLKHLIARIEKKRDQVIASDLELRSLMNEVRKNRSKWASEDNVNQEELYEALDKVLTEMKAHTEYSTPFLKPVSKREAPNYYSIIKTPMDLGTMSKKLKQLNYKSKAEFVTDLNLIWDNCLKYNQDMAHPFRRMANGMRKEAEKLIPLIPDLVVRTRAEVEAEEKRKRAEEGEGGDDSDDDEPIMSSRGRKATSKGTTKSRKAPSDQKEDTPLVDQKPVLLVNGLLGKPGRENSEAVDSNMTGTPQVGGSHTPAGLNGVSGMASNIDAMDVDGPSLNHIALNQALGEAAEQVFEDEDYQLWKQTTKRDRALVTRERHQLFKDNKLNPDAEASLRTKSSMRRFLKHLREAEHHISGQQYHASSSAKEVETSAPETLAEGIEQEPDRVIPDYYETLSNIPSVHPKFQWYEDSEGHVINQHEDFLRVVPRGYFTAPQSRLTKKINDNIRQIQETRKLSSKISVIKQMQVQTQVYANQFPKLNTEPLMEHDIDPHFYADNGPVMAAETCQNALKRAIGKILYHAGFEELQPSAIDAFTGIAEDYFQKLINTFNVYREAEKTEVRTADGKQVQPRFTTEETILHTLDESGHDPSALENYARDEVDRHSSKLGALHERMKIHLTDLLRPALSGDAGADGVGAFKDGSDQFVSGDFADDLGEDFFGFRELGLDLDMGGSLQVPFHLLQSRVRNQYQLQNQAAGTDTMDIFESLPPHKPVTRESIQDQIGLVKNFFLAKLHANGDQPLVEDEDLPVKQRKPRPRLGASGKIVSAQKRPPREQIALAKKKKKLEAQAAEAKLNPPPPDKAGSTNNTPVKKKTLNYSTAPATAVPNPAMLALAPSMERVDSMQSQGGASQTDQDDMTGPASPGSNAQ